MKKSLVLTALIAASFGASAAKIDLANTDSAEIELAGKILPVCKVNVKQSDDQVVLDLTEKSKQKVGKVQIWCNYGLEETRDVTYRSAFGGNLRNEFGDDIAYKFKVGSGAFETLEGDGMRVPQDVGLNDTGVVESTNIFVKPLVNGYEKAGAYRDTIRVKVEQPFMPI